MRLRRYVGAINSMPYLTLTKPVKNEFTLSTQTILLGSAQKLKKNIFEKSLAPGLLLCYYRGVALGETPYDV